MAVRVVEKFAVADVDPIPTLRVVTIRKVAVALPGVVLSILLLMSQVAPGDAVSNLASWANLFGISAWPVWLTDQRVRWVAVIVAALVYSWLGRRHISFGVRWLAQWRIVRRLPSQASSVRPKPMSYEDRRAEQDEIQQLRSFWNRHAKVTTNTLHNLFDRVLYELRKRGHYWAEILDPHPAAKALELAAQELDTAVADDSILRLEEVHERISSWYTAYRAVCRWLSRMSARKEVDLEDEHLAGQYHGWQSAHVAMRNKIEDIAERPAHKRKMKIFEAIENRLLDAELTAFLDQTLKWNHPPPDRNRQSAPSPEIAS